MVRIINNREYTFKQFAVDNNTNTPQVRLIFDKTLLEGETVENTFTTIYIHLNEEETKQIMSSDDFITACFNKLEEQLNA
jgi:hypothetical protein